jgi:hypothetical protein
MLPFLTETPISHPYTRVRSPSSTERAHEPVPMRLWHGMFRLETSFHTLLSYSVSVTISHRCSPRHVTISHRDPPFRTRTHGYERLLRQTAPVSQERCAFGIEGFVSKQAFTRCFHIRVTTSHRCSPRHVTISHRYPPFRTRTHGYERLLRQNAPVSQYPCAFGIECFVSKQAFTSCFHPRTLSRSHFCSSLCYRVEQNPPFRTQTHGHERLLRQNAPVNQYPCAYDIECFVSKQAFTRCF